MSNGASNHIIRGTLLWAKVLGEPRPNYQKDGREWTVEVVPDAEGMKLLKSLKLTDRVKQKDDGPSMTFRQRELRSDGQRNRAPTVVNGDGTPFSGDAIGNGSVGDVKFRVVDYGAGRKKGVYLSGIRVLDLKEFQRQEFSPLSESDQYYTKAEVSESFTDADFKRDFDLDDDIPE